MSCLSIVSQATTTQPCQVSIATFMALDPFFAAPSSSPGPEPRKLPAASYRGIQSVAFPAITPSNLHLASIQPRI